MGAATTQCKTCPGRVPTWAWARGFRRCPKCLKEKPGRQVIGSRPHGPCRTCSGFLTHADHQQGCTRCKACRRKKPGRDYNEPPKPIRVKEQAPAWWVGAKREGFSELAAGHASARHGKAELAITRSLSGIDA
jgi:hypothetical protein